MIARDARQRNHPHTLIFRYQFGWRLSNLYLSSLGLLFCFVFSVRVVTMLLLHHLIISWLHHRNGCFMGQTKSPCKQFSVHEPLTNHINLINTSSCCNLETISVREPLEHPLMECEAERMKKYEFNCFSIIVFSLQTLTIYVHDVGAYLSLTNQIISRLHDAV